MAAFLLWIGLYNVFGALVMAAMHHEPVADWVLRRGTEIVAEPYVHGKFGRLWLWCAATANLFLGAVMVLATRWDSGPQRDVALMVVVVYLAMYVVAIVGGRRPRYGRGIYALHFLWPAQILWGVWAIYQAR